MAYFNIEEFLKGNQYKIYTPDDYRRWMGCLSLVQNPMIAFVDNEPTSVA